MACDRDARPVRAEPSGWNNYIMRKYGWNLRCRAVPALIAKPVCDYWSNQIGDVQEEAALTLVKVVECDDFKDGLKI